MQNTMNRDFSKWTLGFQDIIFLLLQNITLVANIHSGFLGFGEKDIVINQCNIVATWDEEVTKYQTETEYRTVTKNRTVTKKITIIEKIMGDFQEKLSKLLCCTRARPEHHP